MPKNKPIRFDRLSKNAKYRFIINSEKKTGGVLTVLVNYQSLLSNIFPLAPPQLFFFIKYRRNRLLQVSFIV